MPRQRSSGKSVAVAFSLVTLVVSLAMMPRLRGRRRGLPAHRAAHLDPQFGASYSLGVNGIGVTLILLTTVLTPIVVLSAWDDRLPGNRSANAYLAWMLVLEGLAIGVFSATDAFLFYVLFEATLVPLYFLIGSYGGPHRSYAAVKFLIYNLVGGLLMLAGDRRPVRRDVPPGRGDVPAQRPDEPRRRHHHRAAAVPRLHGRVRHQGPLWPFHTWLPDAAASATPSRRC